MPKRNHGAIEPGEQIVVDARPENRERNRSNWLRALVMGAAIGAVITLSAILLFEWYFFTVVDGLAINLRPIAEALREVDRNAQTRLLNPQHSQKQLRLHSKSAAIEQPHSDGSGRFGS